MIIIGTLVCVGGIMIILKKYTLKLHKEIEEEEEELVKSAEKSRKVTREGYEEA